MSIDARPIMFRVRLGKHDQMRVNVQEAIPAARSKQHLLVV